MNFYDYEAEDAGFEILDFPCNQFGNQAPGTTEEIASFCDAKFGITFKLFSKIEVNGENTHPLYNRKVSEDLIQTTLSPRCSKADYTAPSRISVTPPISSGTLRSF